MTDHYEDEEETRERQLSNSNVLAFVAGYWRRRPWLMAGTVALTLIAIGFDLMMPWAAGRLVDAVADRGTPIRPGAPGRSSSGCTWPSR